LTSDKIHIHENKLMVIYKFIKYAPNKTYDLLQDYTTDLANFDVRYVYLFYERKGDNDEFQQCFEYSRSG
jgi:hypothetical protein